MSSLIATYHGATVLLALGPLGLSVKEAVKKYLIPWGDIHFVEFERPGTMTITRVAENGDHENLHFTNVLANLDEAWFERMASDYR